MSRVLYNGNNQITQSYEAHKNKVLAGQGWAIGVDVVKYKNQCDYVVAHTQGTVLKVVDYLDGTNGVLDREQMGYGNYVMILHDNNLVTLYAHMEKVCVKQGQKVAKGQKLGFIGNTGNSTGAHLHFEIRQNTSVPTTATLHDNTKFSFLNAEKYLDTDLPMPSTTVKATGYLDYVQIDDNGIMRCGGWAYKGKGEQVVTIKVLDNGETIAKFDVIANGSRPDVKSAMNYATDKVGFNGAYDFGKLENGLYTISAFVGNDVLKNVFTIENKKQLDENSYPDYAPNGNDYYRVRKTFADSKTSLGSFRKWTGAYNTWNGNKDKGYHIYNTSGKQLD